MTEEYDAIIIGTGQRPTGSIVPPPQARVSLD